MTDARPPDGSDARRLLRMGSEVYRFVAVDELDDGYAFAYPATTRWRSRVQKLSDYWHQALPAYQVELRPDPEQRRIWLRVTSGSREAREYLSGVVAFGRSGHGPKLQRQGLSLRARGTKWSQRASRRLTSPLRVLPDFLVIGAAKCGTSSLYSHLVTHPAIAPALKKEIYFFDHAFERGLGHYRSQFPTVLEKRRCENSGAGAFRTGEATPCYLFHPHVPRRVAATLPGARLIVLLRNPVDRAYSHYNMTRRMLFEDLSFEDAIDREPARVAGELERMTEDENYFSYRRWHFSYLGRGRYAEQLERWLACFPREQLLILTSGDLFAAPAESYREIMAHLGLPAWQPAANHRTNFIPYPRMSPETRQRLVEYFAPHNQRLYELLGREFDWDK